MQSLKLAIHVRNTFQTLMDDDDIVTSVAHPIMDDDDVVTSTCVAHPTHG
jgi:hypothetical protein